MRDNENWHKQLRTKALKDPEILAEYEQFRLAFESEQLKIMCQKDDLDTHHQSPLGFRLHQFSLHDHE